MPYVANKKTAPIDADQFGEYATPLEVTIDGRRYLAKPRVFKSGSLGFHVNGSTNITIDGIEVPCTVNVLLTVKGSKPDAPAVPNVWDSV
jgi:hypothetical protein